MERATHLIKFVEILNIDWNCASTQMASILCICDYTSVYNALFSSLVKLGFNKITFVIIGIVLNALARDLWPTMHFA